MLPPEDCPSGAALDRSRKGSFRSSLIHAWDGLVYVVQCERNARIHVLIAFLIAMLSIWLRVSALEWALIIVAITLVFTGEMLNTVIELLVDMITQERHPLAKQAKDVAAGAILVASMAAALIGFLVLGPRLWLRLVALWQP